MMFNISLIVAIILLKIFSIQGEVQSSSGDGGKYEVKQPDNQWRKIFQGRDGVSGRDGRDGPVGPPGFPGFPGLKGQHGEKGEVGQTGSRGLPGDHGVPGPSGLPGKSGLPGAPGAPGPLGPPGLRGLPGLRGNLGVQGPTGDPGQIGPQGNAGVQGPPGSRGSRGVQGVPGPQTGGVTYTRWGRSICHSGANRLYGGRTGTSFNEHSGGGANYLCMPNDPQYLSTYRPGVQGHSYVYGAEYEGPPLVPGRVQHNAPCAVCHIPSKFSVIMIPAKYTCPSGWTREYYGYLMSENIANPRTMYECVDVSMESVPGSQNHIDGGHFWHVEAHCNGLACPPYNNYKELSCVVCSK